MKNKLKSHVLQSSDLKSVSSCPASPLRERTHRRPEEKVLVQAAGGARLSLCSTRLSVTPALLSASLLCHETQPGSLGEALLDGHVGEEVRELLDNSHVHLRAEGDVQQVELRTRLQELLQRGGAHQPSACRGRGGRGGRRERSRKRG